MQWCLKKYNKQTWQKCISQSWKIFTHCFFSYSGVDFGYEGQKPLFKNVDFGIDMESRSKYAAFTKIHLSSRTMTNALQSNNSCTCIWYTLESIFRLYKLASGKRVATQWCHSPLCPCAVLTTTLLKNVLCTWALFWSVPMVCHYTPDDQPAMHTPAFSAVFVNEDTFWRSNWRTFCF